VFVLHVHLVFVTKYRRRVFSADRLETIFSEVCQGLKAELLEFNGESDHVHLLVCYPPKVAVSHLVGRLKGVSSRRIAKQMPGLKRGRTLWSPSYFAGSCGGAPLSTLIAYIQQQSGPS